MLGKIGRLFVIKTRFEAFAIIYALALGAVERGSVYLKQYPGFGGKLLFLACTGSVNHSDILRGAPSAAMTAPAEGSLRSSSACAWLRSSAPHKTSSKATPSAHLMMARAPVHRRSPGKEARSVASARV